MLAEIVFCATDSWNHTLPPARDYTLQKRDYNKTIHHGTLLWSLGLLLLIGEHHSNYLSLMSFNLQKFPNIRPLHFFLITPVVTFCQSVTCRKIFQPCESSWTFIVLRRRVQVFTLRTDQNLSTLQIERKTFPARLKCFYLFSYFSVFIFKKLYLTLQLD